MLGPDSARESVLSRLAAGSASGTANDVEYAESEASLFEGESTAPESSDESIEDRDDIVGLDAQPLRRMSDSQVRVSFPVVASDDEDFLPPVRSNSGMAATMFVGEAEAGAASDRQRTARRRRPVERPRPAMRDIQRMFEEVKISSKRRILEAPKTSVPLPVREGELYKRSPSKLGGWQKRYLLLRHKQLLYYKKKESQHPIGCLDFDLVKFKLQCMWQRASQVNKGTGLFNWQVLACCCCGREKGTVATTVSALKDVPTAPDSSEFLSFRLAPEGSKRVFEFRGRPQDVRSCVNAILIHMASSHSTVDRSIVASEEKFWAVRRIAPYKFAEIAANGDVILFKSRQGIGRLQRLATGSGWDHVGMVLRSCSSKGVEKLVMLEALGDSGVTLTDWGEFLRRGWYTNYKKVAIRRVLCEKTPQRLESLLKFCHEHVGKPYGLTIKKLLRHRSLDGTRKDFFCSELVCMAWKAMRILKPSKVISTKVWPGNFGAGHDQMLPLEDDVSLSGELVIDFNLPWRPPKNAIPPA